MGSIVIEVNPVSPEIGLYPPPKSVTEAGVYRLVKSLQPEKELTLTLCTVSGIAKSPTIVAGEPPIRIVFPLLQMAPSNNSNASFSCSISSEESDTQFIMGLKPMDVTDFGITSARKFQQSLNAADPTVFRLWGRAISVMAFSLFRA